MKKLRFNNFTFIICAIAACVGTYVTLARPGIVKFFLVAPVCALMIGLMKGTSNLIKASLFSIFSLIYAFVFLEGERRAVALFAMVALIVCAIGFGKLVEKSKEKRIFILPAALCAIFCFGVTVIVFGSPIKAISVKNELDQYIEETYEADEFIYEDYGFDGKKYGYTVTAKNDRTASGIRIYLNKSGIIVDEYETHLKKTLMRPTAESIITVIRESHPNDGFSVYGKDISGLVKPMSIYDETDYSETMDFYIYVSNEMLFKDFASLTREYFEELITAGIKFNSITFIGGEKGRMIFELTAKYGLVCNNFELLVEKHDFVEFSLEHIDFK